MEVLNEVLHVIQDQNYKGTASSGETIKDHFIIYHILQIYTNNISHT